MQIYVVRQGDTLWNIARAFNSSVNEIISANQIPEPDRLVLGQALVIPIVGSFYWVQPGDSLWKIGNQFGINYMTLASTNQIDPNRPLRVGLRLYIPPRPKSTIESNGYIEPIGSNVSENLLSSLEEAAPLLTYVAPFSFQARADGTINPMPLNGIPEIAQENNASLMMVVTNIEDGQFSGTLAKSILESEAVQDLLLDNIINETERLGQYSDVHFDFEYIPSDLRENYNSFLRKAAERLRANNLLISSALAPKTSAEQAGQWYMAHDYKAHGEIVDFVVLMTYEWGYSGGPPMPVSPIGPVERVLNYALTEIPANKIMMGQNLYGYDWTLPYVSGGEFAKAISPQQAIIIARDNNVSIRYDSVAQAPHFNYYDNLNRLHKVWFEDARSIQAKFDLLKRLNLRGISYWKLGLPFPQNWLLLDNNFNITKR